MADILALWMPILVSSVAVFLVSWVVHTLLPWHKGDFLKAPSEDKLMDAMRPFAIQPGDYMVPRCDSMKEMGSPEFLAKLNKGPVFVATVYPNGGFTIGKSLAQWFVYIVVITSIAACIATTTIAKPVSPHLVFHTIALSTFLGYSGAICQSSIWYHRSWGTTVRSTIDGLVFALCTGGIFMWLWPK